MGKQSQNNQPTGQPEQAEEVEEMQQINPATDQQDQQDQQTNEELVQAIQDLQDSGKDARELLGELYEQNQKFIIKLARNYSGTVEIDDLMQEGFLALVDAVTRYDTKTGCTFLNYFAYWLKAHFGKLYAGTKPHLSTGLFADIRKYKRIATAYYMEHGTDIPEQVASLYFTEGVETIRQIQKYINADKVGSLDAPVPNDDSENLTPLDALPDTCTDVEGQILKEVWESELQEVWEIVGNILPADESEILRQYYKEELPRHIIATNMHTTESHCRTMQDRALRTLKKNGSQLRPYWDEISTAYNMGLHGTGIGAWKERGSATERTAIKLYERDRRRKERQATKTTKAMGKSLLECVGSIEKELARLHEIRTNAQAQAKA